MNISLSYSINPYGPVHKKEVLYEKNIILEKYSGKSKGHTGRTAFNHKTTCRKEPERQRLGGVLPDA